MIGWGYKEYNSKGNILGFRLERVGNTQQSFSPSDPTITVYFKVNPTQNQKAIIPSATPILAFTPVPVTLIKIINFHQSIKLNENAAFTWEITGPQKRASFTAIVGAKESKKGSLDKNTKLDQTPYRVLTKEFISGNYEVPLVFIGNSTIPEYGTWYIRALAVIDGIHFWTDEFSLVVK